MVIKFVPRNGGYWRRGGLNGDGQCINDNIHIVYDGTFSSQKLNGSTCYKINYHASDFVYITSGPFSNGLENGAIVEYVFSKSNWSSFLTGTSTASTKYLRTYSDGNLVSTQSSGAQNISGAYNVIITFSE